MRAQICPTQLNSKIGSENEGMLHEGCRQNRSSVYQMPVLLGHFQPGTSFLQIIIWRPIRSEAEHTSPTSWRAPRGPQASRPVRSGARHQGPSTGYQPTYMDIGCESSSTWCASS